MRSTGCGSVRAATGGRAAVASGGGMSGRGRPRATTASTRRSSSMTTSWALVGRSSSTPSLP
eukprot:2543265-Alexandrium_andersonii.AAC.1